MTDPTLATRILKCGGCGSHFEAPLTSEPSEDPAAGLRCATCLHWQQLLEQRASYEHAVRGQRGGRR